MKPDELEILYEDNHLLVVNKPAGLPTQGSLPGEPSLVQVAKQYIKSRYQKPGNVYLGVVSRLDSKVTGVVVLARTSKAAARLTSQFASGEASKTYWAIISSEPNPSSGRCVDWLLHDDAKQKVVVAKNATTGAKEARLTYSMMKRLNTGWLLEVQLETGRKHQIRVQLAARGWPICGDKKYGSRSPWPVGIALHARRLEIMHPVRPERLAFVAPVGEVWHRVGVG